MNRTSIGIYRIVSCVALLILLACGKPPRSHQDLLSILTADKDTVTWQLLPSDEIVPRPHGLIVSDSTLAVLGLYQGNWVQIYDTDSGKHITSFLRKGQGPGEIVSGEDMTALNDSMLCVFDLHTRSIAFTNIHTGSALQTTNLTEIEPVIWNCWALTDNKVLIKFPVFSPDHKLSRGFALVDIQTSNKLSDYRELSEEFSANYNMLTSQPNLTLSPDKKHFASTTMVGGTLEIFDIVNDDLVPVCSEVVRQMKYIEKNGVPSLDEPFFFVFISSCSSNERIYTSYAASENPDKATKIAVWDWQGNLLECYETNKLIHMMAYDATSDTIYGIVESDDGPALARLDMK